MQEEDVKTKFEEFTSHSSDLGQTILKLAKIKTTRTTIDISSLFIVRVILWSIAVIAILFCSVATALWLGYLLHSLTAGLFAVGGFYIFLLTLLFTLKDKLLLPFLRNRMVRKIYE